MNYILSYTMERLTELLFAVADISRSIFSLAITEKDTGYGVQSCKTYQNIRLTCKRFKVVLDTVSVRGLFLGKRRGKKAGTTTLVEKVNINKLLHAPIVVLRTFLLVEPEERLRQIQHALFRYYTLCGDPTNKAFRFYVRRNIGNDDTKKLWGCRIEYSYYNERYFDVSYEHLLGRLQDYLGFDSAIRQ